jgi:FkbM family methyltransferase
MANGYQYNEAEILRDFFGDHQGLVVEIGAADGIDNSNSYELVKRGWSALLVEPHPQYVHSLRFLYGENPLIHISDVAISDYSGKRSFCLNGQCSSLVNFPRQPAIIEVDCITLNELFERHNITKVDFLSVDVEGHDLAVLDSLTWQKYMIDLVCVEHSMPKEQLDKFMLARGYVLYDRNVGNSFYEIIK